MVWCNAWLPEKFLELESGAAKVGGDDRNLHFSCFSMFFVFEIWYLGFDLKISCVALVFSPGLNFDSWFHIALRLGFHIFVLIGLIFLLNVVFLIGDAFLYGICAWLSLFLFWFGIISTSPTHENHCWRFTLRSKSVNSFGATVFFRKIFWLWLSIGRTKSQNEFVTKELRWTKGWFHGTEKFRKSKISWNIDAGDVWSYHFQWIFFADAYFIVCGACLSYCYMTRRAVSLLPSIIWVIRLRGRFPAEPQSLVCAQMLIFASFLL